MEGEEEIDKAVEDFLVPVLLLTLPVMEACRNDRSNCTCDR